MLCVNAPLLGTKIKAWLKSWFYQSSVVSMDLPLNSLWDAPVSGSESEAIISGAPLAYRSKCWDPRVRAITDMRCKRDEKVNWRSTPISYGIDWNQKIHVMYDGFHFILWITPHEGASSTAIPIFKTGSYDNKCWCSHFTFMFVWGRHDLYMLLKCRRKC